MKILVTGSAGFIGSALSIKLLERGNRVIGIDNHNDYYDQALKEARLLRHINHPNYTHIKIDIEEREVIAKLFNNEKFEAVVNLAAQAGVRYSIDNPFAYVDTNITGFANILEASRLSKVGHLVYASSSNVYGLNTKQPFSTHQSVDHPASLYAATKKANELMAHSYSSLYKLPTTGLRFFNVYGPYDRPDMALQKFTTAIMNDEPINVFNYGKNTRDFTYIDDVVETIVRILDKPALPNPTWNSNKPDPATSSAPYRVYNIGNNKPLDLLALIDLLESLLGKKIKKELLPPQQGDLPNTYAEVDDLVEQFDYKPSMNVQKGLDNFVKWFKEYNKLK